MGKLIKDCDNCKHAMKNIYERPCNLCKRGKPDNWEPIPRKTNADRIRAMSDEELARFICTDEVCNWDSGEDDIPDIIRWLQSEVE